jgi:hypothetical protein
MKFDTRRKPKASPKEVHNGRLTFVPATKPVHVGEGVFYRPLRSWHSGVYAGELLEIVGGDRSGCCDAKKEGEPQRCYVPKSYTHRWYWHEDEPDCTISAFLSYPGGLGISGEYFWEANIADCERFSGAKAEERLERAILTYLRRRRAKAKRTKGKKR